MNKRSTRRKRSNLGRWMIRPSEGEWQLWYMKPGRDGIISRTTGILHAYVDLRGVFLFIVDPDRVASGRCVRYVLSFPSLARTFTFLQLSDVVRCINEKQRTSEEMDQGLSLIRLMTYLDGRMDEILGSIGDDAIFVGSFGSIDLLAKQSDRFKLVSSKDLTFVSPYQATDGSYRFIVRGYQQV